MSTNRRPVWAAFVFLLFATLGCGFNLDTVATGPTQNKVETVELAGADSVAVAIEMGVGELNIDGGAGDLLEAEFTYNVEDWEPDVSYSVSGAEGQLRIQQPESEIGVPDDNIKYRWDLRFSDDTPLAMDISLGAGESDLDLSRLNLTTLVVNAGAGQVALSIGGSGLTQGEFNAGVGELTLDFSGSWTEDAAFDVSAGIGGITLIVPNDVGVRILLQTGLGSVNPGGLSRDGDAYVNDVFGDGGPTVTINVQGGVGDVTLRLAE